MPADQGTKESAASAAGASFLVIFWLFLWLSRSSSSHTRSLIGHFGSPTQVASERSFSVIVGPHSLLFWEVIARDCVISRFSTVIPRSFYVFKSRNCLSVNLQSLLAPQNPIQGSHFRSSFGFSSISRSFRVISEFRLRIRVWRAISAHIDLCNLCFGRSFSVIVP